jgi:hypothetical protein
LARPRIGKSHPHATGRRADAAAIIEEKCMADHPQDITSASADPTPSFPLGAAETHIGIAP